MTGFDRAAVKVRGSCPQFTCRPLRDIALLYYSKWVNFNVELVNFTIQFYE
jgi:hypothetical protein